MQLRIVRSAEIRPQKCVFYPQIGNTHPKGYIDTGMDMLGVDPHAYISIQAVEDIARELKYLTPADHEALSRQLVEANEKIMALEQELNEASNVLDAIDAIESVGFRARKKPGRKARVSKDRDYEDQPA